MAIYRWADHTGPYEHETRFEGGALKSRRDPAGIPCATLEELLPGRTVYRGHWQERQAAADARAEQNLFFQVRCHDIGHVAGRGVGHSSDWAEAVEMAERISREGGDCTVEGFVRGIGPDGCEFGRWSAGRLIQQSVFVFDAA